METWTMLKTEKIKIEAFEAFCWSRTLKIPWTEMVKNTEVLVE